VISERYIPEVRKGDTRSSWWDGSCWRHQPGAASGEARAKMHVGGRPEATELDSARKGDMRRHRTRV